MDRMLPAKLTILLKFQLIWMILLILCSCVILVLTTCTNKGYYLLHIAVLTL